MLGAGATMPFDRGPGGRLFAAVALGDRLAKSARKSAPGAAKQGKWDR